MTDAAVQTAAAPQPAVKEQTPFRRFVAQFLEDRVAVVGLVLLTIIVLLALLAPVISPQNPYDLARVDLMDSKLPPGEMAATASACGSAPTASGATSCRASSMACASR